MPDGLTHDRFCLKMGWLYTRLVAANSFFTEAQDIANEEDRALWVSQGTSSLSTHVRSRLSDSIQEFMSMYETLSRLIFSQITDSDILLSGNFICKSSSSNFEGCSLKLNMSPVLKG